MILPNADGLPSTSVDDGLPKLAWFQMLKKSAVKRSVLPLREAEILMQREIPVLLEGPAIDVSAQVAEARGAGVRIDRAPCRIGQRREGEVVEVHIAIDPVVDIA